jgi:hypothetical protein
MFGRKRSKVNQNFVENGHIIKNGKELVELWSKVGENDQVLSILLKKWSTAVDFGPKYSTSINLIGVVDFGRF